MKQTANQAHISIGNFSGDNEDATRVFYDMQNPFCIRQYLPVCPANEIHSRYLTAPSFLPTFKVMKCLWYKKI
jgi:hypothetical protein